VNTIRSRRDREAALNIKGLTRIEKGKIYGGDKTIMYEKLGLVEENDLERYRKKLGIKKGVDLTSMDVEDVDSILEKGSQNLSQAVSASANPKKKQTYMQKKKLDYDREEFKKIIGDLKEEKEKLEIMDEEERKQYQEEKLKLKEVFRDEDVKHYPIIIKASTAGVLETLLKETDKFIKGIYRVNVIDYSVGPITEGDLSNAH
jgi:Translation-initiation factor 2